MGEEKTFAYIGVHIVGNPSQWEYSYDISSDSFSSVKEAYHSGMGDFGHDDFIVGEFKNGKCIAVHIYEKGRFTKSSKDYGEYVRGINKEIGE